MPRKLVRRWIDRSVGNDWERLIRRARRAKARRFLLMWNRGLGDIALGLCQVIDELRADVPGAEITVITRADLAAAFQLVRVDRVIVDPDLVRSRHDSWKTVLRRLGIDRGAYDLAVSRIDPTRWFMDKARAEPRLEWPANLDALSHRFDATFADPTSSITYIGAHVQCETDAFYSYRKDWPVTSWAQLFARVGASGKVRFVLFGHGSAPRFDDRYCIDLRGRTTFPEMMAVIKRRCAILIAPDSGVLTMTYYLGDQFPVGIVSLWADPRQGILKQGAASPNRLLCHVPLRSADEQVASIGVDAVAGACDRLLEAVPQMRHEGDATRRGRAA